MVLFSRSASVASPAGAYHCTPGQPASEQTQTPARSRPASANCRAPPTKAKTWEKVRGHGHVWRTDCGGGRRYRAMMDVACASTRKSLQVWEAILRRGGRCLGTVDNIGWCILVGVGSPCTPKINPIYTAGTFMSAPYRLLKEPT